MDLPLKKFSPLFFSLVFTGIIVLIVGLTKKSGYHITYAVTKSVPQGLYLVIPTKKIERHDMVEFIPPQPALNFIKEKRWCPQSGSVIKYVFAIPNDHVCIHHQAIWINGKKIGRVYKFYASNKLLPQIKICGKLKENQYLLLSTESERSFDGRYFGVISLEKIFGKAVRVF